MKKRLVEDGYEVTTTYVVYTYTLWGSALDRSVKSDLEISRITLHSYGAITTIIIIITQ